MAGNSPFSSGTSSLLRSAASLQKTVQDYQDQIAAYNFRYSGYTDDSFQSYADYLKGRITDLQTSGSTSSLQKALTLQGTLMSATHDNISASITRENIQIMAGNSTPTDKLNLISNQYVRALNNNDFTLAQQLESQAYSLSQQIQNDAVTAGNAAKTLNESNLTATAKGYSDTVKALQDQVKQFNVDYAHAGAKSLDKATSDFVKQITPQLNALGIYLGNGVKPTYFDVVQGVNQAQFKYYTLAAQTWNGVDDTKAQGFVDKANALMDSIPTAFGNFTIQQLQQAQANPNQFALRQDPEFIGKGKSGIGGSQNPQVGYNYTASGVQPKVATSPWVDVPADAKAQIEALNLRVIGGKAGTNGVEVAATGPGNGNPGSPEWLRKAIPADSTVHLVYGTNNVVDGPSGVKYNPNIVSFEADSVTGQGKAVYTIVRDPSGKQGIFESSNQGDRLLSSEPGYNPNPQLKVDPTADQRQIGFQSNGASGLAHAPNGAGFDNFFNLGGGPASHLINSAQIQQAQIAAANAKAAAAMLSQAPPSLPNISIAQPPTQNISVNNQPSSQRITIPTYPNTSIAPKTVNPQGPTLSPQSPGGFNLQGGGGIRLQ